MKKRRKKKAAPADLATKKSEPEKTDKAFDFGGLPDRNLKKNLGC